MSGYKENIEVEEVVAGTNVTVDSTDPKRPIVSSTGAGGSVDSVVAGTNVTVDNTDPANPIISSNGGSVQPVVSKTGSTIEFTEDALYNIAIPITTGNITINSTGAIAGSVINFYYKGINEPDIINGNYSVVSGYFSSDILMIYSFLWNTDGTITLNIVADERPILKIPNATITTVSTQNTINRGLDIDLATTYEILFNTVDDIATASAVPTYNGTDTVYTHTGLTDNQNYYYWVTAKGEFHLDSVPRSLAISCGNPNVNALFSYGFKLDSLDGTKFIRTTGGSGITYIQNEEGTFKDLSSGDSGSYKTITSANKFEIDTSLSDYFFSFDIVSIPITVTGEFIVSLSNTGYTNVISFRTDDVNTNRQVSITSTGATSLLNLGVFEGSFKVGLVNNLATFYKWNSTTSNWDILGSLAFTDDVFFIRFVKQALTTINNQFIFDNIFVTTADFNGQYPTI